MDFGSKINLKQAETKTEKEILKVTREVLNSDEIYVDDNITIRLFIMRILYSL